MGRAGGQGWGAGKFFSGSGSWLFFQAAPAPAPAPVFFSSGSGSKEPKTPGSDRLRLPSPAGGRLFVYLQDKSI
jgi:hypothetical protein